MNALTHLEKDVLRLLLDGDSVVLTALRTQLESAIIGKRTHSGVGFFVDFEVDPKNLSHELSEKSFQLTDVIAEVADLKHGMGFVLFIKDGFLSMLEGHTYDGEELPSNLTCNYQCKYLNGEARDLEKVRELWS